MTQIDLTHASFARADARLARAVDGLADDRDRIDTRVGGLLGAGWRGAAADAFDEAWADWRRAADEVTEGLSTMRRLLGAVHRDYVEADEGSEAALARLSSRLVDRLGAS